MDIAYESIMSNASRVWMGIRGGFLSFPKVLNNFRVLGTTFEGNLPIDGLITNLFETAYVHPWVSASHLRWFVSDFVIRRVLWALTGTMAGCNQWAGELPPERQGRAYVFLNKSAKAMQFINRPYFKMGWFHRLFAHYIDPPLPEGIDDPTIYVVPFATSFDETGRAIFPCPPEHRRKEMAWKKECRPDLVVLCTGYRQEWDWLGEGYPKGPEECDVRGVCSSRDLSVGFIGFLRPGVGESLLPQISNSPHFNWIVWNGFRSFYKRYICAWSLADAHVRRNPTNGRTPSSTVPPTYDPIHPNPYITGDLPPPPYTYLSHPIWRGLLNLYGPARTGYGECAEFRGAFEGVRLVHHLRLLVGYPLLSV